MTAPASSTPRGTAPTSSTSAPASSPLTASVIKFRCLYTHDLRRKSKRWQDGYLRYHAFNKRVMVYDETGNYIGDHHWRSNDEVQDGDEMELDKGALIQVGERMGSTQTDLTNLLEKRKSTQGSPQANDPASQTPRASAPIRSSGSSQPFRSLNELLGIKKTPIGHLVSPYEERHPPTPAANVLESSERAPKRQKVSLVEKAPVNKRNTQSQVVDLTIQDDEPPVTRAPNVAQGRTTPRAHGEAEPPRNHLGPKNQASSVVRSPNVAKESDSARSDISIFAHPVSPPPNASRTQPPKPVPLVAPSNSRSEQSEARKTANTATKAKSRESPRETPRQAARPQQGLGQRKPTLPEDIPQKGTESPNPVRSDQPTFAKPALPSWLESYRSRPSRPMPPTAAKDGRSEQSEDGKVDSGVVPPTDKSTPNLPRGPVNTLRMSSGKPRRKLMYSALLPGDASQSSTPGLSSSSPGSQSRSILKPDESQPAAARLREIESTSAEFMPSDSTQFILDEMTAPCPETDLARKTSNPASIHQNPTLQRKLPTKRALDAPFRKSLSDPTALTNVQTRPTLTRSALSAVPEQQEHAEAGPWTSEALDLFDFWPPGRPKPNCAD
ncbi:hypothetical protein PMG11_08659 [Penicillium brasilianum]|uniref:5'-3' DNA helicase ZGRF1-like N-terminal domain-containing protein n=1 Tax=Penicillium brasilianum TaxID=104259 RepID=A0A0F7TTR4_PENBI|nr:hypothetical protein PMG11_08659 [Penicillium brasilianum]